MVEVNKEKKQINITISGNWERVLDYQKALIRIMQNFDFETYGVSAENPFWFILELLENLLPDEKQINSIALDTNILELPENISTQQKKQLKDALLMIADPKMKISNNPVFDALQKITA